MSIKNYAQAMLEGLLFAMEEDARINLVGGSLFGLGPQRAVDEVGGRIHPSILAFAPPHLSSARGSERLRRKAP